MNLFIDKKFQKPIDEKYLKPKNILAEYSKMWHNDRAYFVEVENDFENFYNYEPGTVEWMIIWKAHPEIQEEMLEYANSKKASR